MIQGVSNVSGGPLRRIRSKTSDLLPQFLQRGHLQPMTGWPRVVMRGSPVYLDTSDGQTFVWFGARKQTGRGEKSSGLAFDQIPPKPPQS